MDFEGAFTVMHIRVEREHEMRMHNSRAGLRQQLHVLRCYGWFMQMGLDCASEQRIKLDVTSQLIETPTGFQQPLMETTNF